MRKFLLSAVCVLALLPLSAQAQTDPAQVGISVGPPGEQTGRDFIQFMLASDKFEIAASRLALKQSRDPAIRDFARQAIAAHRQTTDDLKTVYDRLHVGRQVTPPPAFDPRRQAMYQTLISASGRRFDDIYLAQQYAGHQEALAHLEGYVAHGLVRQLARFAKDTIPVYSDHLARLSSLRGKVVASNTTIYIRSDGSRTQVTGIE